MRHLSLLALMQRVYPGGWMEGSVFGGETGPQGWEREGGLVREVTDGGDRMFHI